MWTAASDQVITQTMNSFGSQSFASTKMEEVFFGATVWPRLDPTDRALVRSQRGPMASIPFHTPPVSAASRFRSSVFEGASFASPLVPAPVEFRNLLVWPATRFLVGHHRGFWVAEGYPLESCAARICREAGARVSVNIRAQDMDLFPGPRADNRRLEVVADGLPLFHGAQLAVDTTMGPHRPS